MAWWIFKKIKDGFKKVIGGIKKEAQWLGNNVLKPIVNAVAPVIDTIKPGVGTALQTGVNALTNLTTGNYKNPKIRLRGYQWNDWSMKNNNYFSHNESKKELATNVGIKDWLVEGLKWNLERWG